MNDPHLIIKKLNELAREAMKATTETEKAAIFGAVRALVNDLAADSPENLSEHIEGARWGICAILGYDTTNGLGQELLLSRAVSALVALERHFGWSPV